MTNPLRYAVECGACGRGLPERARFCSFCGAQVAAAEPDGAAPPTAVSDEAAAAALQPEPAPDASPVTAANIEELLRVLRRLVDDDLISLEDYEERKNRLLDSLTGEG